MSINCEDNYIEMPCGDCLPPPPDKPYPIAFNWCNTGYSRTGSIIRPNGSYIPGTLNFQANASGQLVPNTFLINSPYVTAPTITINSPTAGITATATLGLDSNRKINTIVMTNSGSGYIPFAYYGYTIDQAPLESSITIIGDLSSSYWNNTFNPITYLNSYSPPIGWGVTASSGKVIFKINGTLTTDITTDVHLKWTINNIAQSNVLKIRAQEGKIRKFTYFSKELTLTTGDILKCVLTTSGAHINSIDNVIGLYFPKTL